MRLIDFYYMPEPKEPHPLSAGPSSKESHESPLKEEQKPEIAYGPETSAHLRLQEEAQSQDEAAAKRILHDLRDRIPINKETVSRGGYKNIPFTGRPVGRYLPIFGLKDRESAESFFKDKTVVDFGAGKGEFVNYLLEEGITEKAYAVDMLYGAFEGTDLLKDSEDKPLKNLIAARLDALPFADNSVDIGIASSSLPLHADTKEDIEHFFNEAIRVLRSGGEFTVFPIDKLVESMITGKLKERQRERRGKYAWWLEKVDSLFFNLGDRLLRGMEEREQKEDLFVLNYNSREEMRRLGIRSMKEYKALLWKKYEDAEQWTQECIEEFKKREDIVVEIKEIEQSNGSDSHNVLSVRKK